MKIKPLILLVTLVIASFFLVGTTLSEFPPESTGTYSPWGDLNDDGIINIFDIVWLTGRYQKTGTPVNKTALLYNVSDTFNMLLNKIDDLNSTVIEQQTIINNLNNTVMYLNETITYLNGTSQIIRFYHPDEEVIPYYGTWTVATFTWTPKNSTNNVILSAHAWAEIKCPNQTNSLYLRIRINGTSDETLVWNHMAGPSYEVSSIVSWSPKDYCFPPSESYIIEYDVMGGQEFFPIFIRNINIIIHVADGVPASNP